MLRSGNASSGAEGLQKILEKALSDFQGTEHHAVISRLGRDIEGVFAKGCGVNDDLVERLTEIGLALSGETRLERLLEMIVDEARVLTKADAGTLYVVDREGRKLEFSILQNDTMQVRMGGTSGNEITLPSGVLFILLGNKPNKSNVSSYCGLTGETINIADVYEAEGFDFTGPRKYDAATGYRSKSIACTGFEKS